MALCDWPSSERPRERLLAAGPQSLSDGELLAILLGTGVRGLSATDLARRALERQGGLAGLLGCGAAELARLQGFGPARAARIAAALELGRRYLAAPGDARPALAAPLDAARYLSARLLDLPHEVFSCLFLDTRHRLIRYEELFRGTIDGATVYPREVVKRALQCNASAVIVGHNHPSGVAEPSEADRSITIKLAKALALVEIRLLDHLVVSRGGHVSLAERGLL
ncbi:MAG TPA: DNA repair protein RadC [Gammaproteobacteria bacterium]|nr:DNA repair protein RadC [Gammaproteobacteria bacterium]